MANKQYQQPFQRRRQSKQQIRGMVKWICSLSSIPIPFKKAFASQETMGCLEYLNDRGVDVSEVVALCEGYVGLTWTPHQSDPPRKTQQEIMEDAQRLRAAAGLVRHVLGYTSDLPFERVSSEFKNSVRAENWRRIWPGDSKLTIRGYDTANAGDFQCMSVLGWKLSQELDDISRTSAAVKREREYRESVGLLRKERPVGALERAAEILEKRATLIVLPARRPKRTDKKVFGEEMDALCLGTRLRIPKRIRRHFSEVVFGPTNGATTKRKKIAK